MTDTFRPDEAPGANDPVEDAGHAAPDNHDAPSRPESDAEARAREMGWMDEEQWNADPKRAGKPHRSADEFLRIADESGPVLRERLRKQQERQDRLERTTAEAIRKMEERIRNEEREKYKAALREAVLHGDTAEHDRLLEERDKVLQAPAAANAAPPEVEAWVQSNDWFLKDDQLKMAMINIDRLNEQDHPAMPIAERLEKSRKEVMARYPDRFGAHRPATPQLASTSRLAPKSNKKADKLDATSRRIGEQQVEMGLFKTIEDFAESYFDEEPQKVRA